MNYQRLVPVVVVVALLATAGVLMRKSLPQAYAVDGVVVNGPSERERLPKALDAAGHAGLSEEALEHIAKREGKILVDRPSTVDNLTPTLEVVDLEKEAPLADLLEATDEGAAARALWERGIRSVVLHSRVAPSRDRDSTVLSRLYYHDFVEWFTLTRVSEGTLVYAVNQRPLVFPPQVAALCVQYLRVVLSGQEWKGPFPAIQSETGNWTLVASIRGQGRALARAFAMDKDLRGALNELADDLETDHRRWVEWYGFPRLKDHMADLSIEIERIVERAYIEPRSEDFLESYWEMGIDGAYIMTPDNKERASLPGAAAYTQTIITADKFLRTAAEQGRMSDKRPWRAKDAWLESYRTLHYREIPGVGIQQLYRGVPLVPLGTVTIESTRQSIVHAGEWYLANLQPSGEVNYKFWPAENRFSDEYNLVRHTLGTWNLVQAWEMEPRPEFLEGSERVLGFTNRFLKHEGDRAFYEFDNNRKLGTNVVNMMGIIALSRAKQTHEYDELLKELGNFVLSMQEESGKFNPYYVEEDHPYYDQKNDIVPGEAALSLVMMAEYFDDDKWIAGLPKFWEYYYPWFRDRAKQINREAPWPAYIYENQTRLDLVQFGPWATMAANAYHRRTGNTEVADFGLEIARWMIDSYEYTSERTPYPDYVGGYYKFAGELPAMQAFCYAEGTAAAYGLAVRYAPDQAPFFEKATREAVRFAQQVQLDPQSTYSMTRPELVNGGIPYAMNETKVRIDYVHHALSAMYQWLQAAKDDPNLPPEVRGQGFVRPTWPPQGEGTADAEPTDKDAAGAP